MAASQFKGKPGKGSAEIQVDGLREVAAGFRKMEKLSTLSKHLKLVAEKVAGDARSKVPVRSGDAAGSIRTRSSSGTASVVGGKSKVPYYGWLDFGSRDPKSGQARSVGPWAKTGRGPAKGRFIYPAIEENRVAITDAVAKAVEDAKREAGFYP